jgi:hypothetical protein
MVCGLLPDQAALYGLPALTGPQRLRDQAARQAKDAAGHFRHCLQTVPADEDLAALDDLAARLARFRTTLNAPAPSRGEAAARPGPGTRNRRTNRFRQCGQLRGVPADGGDADR